MIRNGFMPRALGLTILLAIAASAAPSLAQEPDCETAVDQMSLRICARKAYEKADSELNSVYGQVRASLQDRASRLQRLTEAQRAWIAFRDAECAFVASGLEGGSAQPMVQAQCLEAETVRRTASLRALLTCEEGDLSCPTPGARP